MLGSKVWDGKSIGIQTAGAGIPLAIVCDCLLCSPVAKWYEARSNLLVMGLPIETCGSLSVSDRLSFLLFCACKQEGGVLQSFGTLPDAIEERLV